eukprot:GGOE01042727.1.p1 GENE.GGOE01042727.1~~GGOE01042727.1.p1  ORF type:complete len:1757 (-),score=405.95 GGOE01042727.1:494-5710(-)
MASRTQPRRRKVKYSSTLLRDAPFTFFERVGPKVWAGDAAGTITIRNAETGAPEHRLALPAGAAGGVVRCLRASGRQVWAGYSTGTLRILHAETGEVLRDVAAHSAGINDFAFFDQRVYSASDDGTVGVWFSSSVHLHKRYSGHTGPVRCLHCHSDLLFSGSEDESIRVWTTGGTLKAVMNNHKGPVNALVVKNSVLWAAAQQHTITLWDVTSFKKLKVIDQHQSPVRSLLPLHDTVWSCAADRSLCVWDATGFQLVKSFGPQAGAGAMGGMLRGVLHREAWTVWATAEVGCLMVRVERSLQSECDLEGPAEAPSLNSSLTTPRAAHAIAGWRAGDEVDDEEAFLAMKQLREQQGTVRNGREQEPQTEDRAGLSTPPKYPRTPAKSPLHGGSAPSLVTTVAEALLRAIPEGCRGAVADLERRAMQPQSQGEAPQELKYLQCLSALYSWVTELKGDCGKEGRPGVHPGQLEARLEALQELLDLERRMSHEKALRFTTMQSEVQAISRSRLAMELSLEEAKAEGLQLREQLIIAAEAEARLTAELRRLTTQLHGVEVELVHTKGLQEAEAQRWAAAEELLQRQLQEVKEEASALALKFELGSGWPDQGWRLSGMEKENVRPAAHRERKEGDAKASSLHVAPPTWTSNSPKGHRTPLAPCNAASPTPTKLPPSTMADAVSGLTGTPSAQQKVLQRRSSKRSSAGRSPRGDRCSQAKASDDSGGQLLPTSDADGQRGFAEQDADGLLTPWETVGEKAGRSKSLTVMLDLKAVEQGWQQLTSRCHTLQLALAESQERSDDLVHALAEKEDLLREKEEEIHLLKVERRAHLRCSAPASARGRYPEWPGIGSESDTLHGTEEPVPLSCAPQPQHQRHAHLPAGDPEHRTHSVGTAGADARRSTDSASLPAVPLPQQHSEPLMAKGAPLCSGSAAVAPLDTSVDLSAAPQSLALRIGDLFTPRGPSSSPLGSARTPRSLNGRTPRPPSLSRETLAALQLRSPGAESTSLETALIGELGDLIVWAELVDAERDAYAECLAKSEEQRALLATEVTSLTEAILTLRAQVDDLRGRRAAPHPSIPAYTTSLLTLRQRLERLSEAVVHTSLLPVPPATELHPGAAVAPAVSIPALRLPLSTPEPHNPISPEDGQLSASNTSGDEMEDELLLSDCLSLVSQLEAPAAPSVPLASALEALQWLETTERHLLESWAIGEAPRGMAWNRAVQCQPHTAEAAVDSCVEAAADAAIQCRPCGADVAVQSMLVTVTRAVQSSGVMTADVACQCVDRWAEARLGELNCALQVKEAEMLQLTFQVQQLVEQGAGLRRTLATRDQQVAAHEAQRMVQEAALAEQQAVCLTAQQSAVALQAQCHAVAEELARVRTASGDIITAQAQLLHAAQAHQVELEAELLSLRSLLDHLPAAMEQYKESITKALELKCEPVQVAASCCPRCSASHLLLSTYQQAESAESPVSEVDSTLHEVEYERDTARYDVAMLQTQLQEMRTQYEQVVEDLARCRTTLCTRSEALERLQAVASPALAGLGGEAMCGSRLSMLGTPLPSPRHPSRPMSVASPTAPEITLTVSGDPSSPRSAVPAPAVSGEVRPPPNPAVAAQTAGSRVAIPPQSPCCAGRSAGSPAYTTAYAGGPSPVPEALSITVVATSPVPESCPGAPRAASLSGVRLYGSECGSDASGESFRSRASSARSHPLVTLQGSRAVRNAINEDISYIDALIRQHSKRSSRVRDANPNQS